MAQGLTQPEPTGETVLDVGAQRIATVYAKGLLGAAGEAGQTEAVLTEFDELVSDVLKPHPEFGTILGSGLIPHEEKEAVLDRVLGGKISPLLLNFLKVLSKHGRLNLVQQVHHEIRKLYDQQRGLKRVQVTSAAPIDAATQASIAVKLKAMLGGEPVLQFNDDPNLIGGLTLHVGDTVYDGSVATQLKQVREQMIQRSVYEIQRGRDRFRNPAGN